MSGRHRLRRGWQHRSVYGVPCTWWEFKQHPIKVNTDRADEPAAPWRRPLVDSDAVLDAAVALEDAADEELTAEDYFHDRLEEHPLYER